MNLSVHEKLSIFLNRLREYERLMGQYAYNPLDICESVRAIALQMVDEFEVTE